MSVPSDHTTGLGFAALGVTVDLAVVRAELAKVEALEDQVRHRVAHLRTVLSPEQLRHVWALRDAEDRLGLAEQLLAEHALVERLARRVPEHAATIRAEARRDSTGGSRPADAG